MLGQPPVRVPPLAAAALGGPRRDAHHASREAAERGGRAADPDLGREPDLRAAVARLEPPRTPEIDEPGRLPGEDVTRIIGGSAGGRRSAPRPATPPARPPTGCARRCSPILESRVGSCTASPSSTCTPAAGDRPRGRLPGRASVTLVEKDRRTAALVAPQRRTTWAWTSTWSPPRSAALPGRDARGRAVDVVFADPPYPLASAAVAADLPRWRARLARPDRARRRRALRPRPQLGLAGGLRRGGPAQLRRDRAAASAAPAPDGRTLA